MAAPPDDSARQGVPMRHDDTAAGDDTAFRRWSDTLSPERLAVVAIKIDAADRIAAAFGTATAAAVRSATIVAIIDLVGDRGFVARDVADLGIVFVDTAHADAHDLVKAVARRLGATIDVDGVDYFVQTHIGVALPGDGVLAAGDGVAAEPGNHVGNGVADDRVSVAVRGVEQAAIAAVHGAQTRGTHLAYASETSVAALQGEVELATELASAVGEAFTLHYQPIVAIDTFEVVGYESLLRWTVDDRVRLPGEFLDAAEETSLIVPIGRWGVAEAIRQLAVWQVSRHRPELFMSVNFSSQQLLDPHLAAHIAASLAEAGVAPRSLWVEVTERDLIVVDSPASQTIRELDELGCVICVDDLGTGYAALRYMVDQPVQIAKIDRSLIQGIEGDATKRSIVETVCRLSEKLEIHTVAEGVEDESQVALLRGVGFTHAQGYLFGRPLPAGDIVA